MSVGSRYKRLRQEVDATCEKLGRNPEDVLLLAVSKTVGLDAVQEAIEAGAHAFGENRPDELLRKKQAFPQEQWHFIGNIQSRRIDDIVQAADLIHSVYKLDHLEKIDKAAFRHGKVQDILFEVNISGELSKSGMHPSKVKEAIQFAEQLENVAVKGLMTMAPQGDEKAITQTFSGMEQLRTELLETSDLTHIAGSLAVISMGMTEDWPEALAYGSTIVRIGRAIFDDSFEQA